MYGRTGRTRRSTHARLRRQGRCIAPRPQNRLWVIHGLKSAVIFVGYRRPSLLRRIAKLVAGKVVLCCSLSVMRLVMSGRVLGVLSMLCSPSLAHSSVRSVFVLHYKSHPLYSARPKLAFMRIPRNAESQDRPACLRNSARQRYVSITRSVLPLVKQFVRPTLIKLASQVLLMQNFFLLLNTSLRSTQRLGLVGIGFESVRIEAQRKM